MIRCREMLGLYEAKIGTKIDELLQAAASEYKRAWQDVKTNSDSRRRQGSLPKRQKHEKLKDKKIITRKEYQRLLNKLEMEGFMAQKGLWNLAEEGDAIR